MVSSTRTGVVRTLTDGRSRPWFVVLGVCIAVLVVGALGFVAWSAVTGGDPEVSADVVDELVDFEQVAMGIGSIDGGPPVVRKVVLECDSSSDGEMPTTTVSFDADPSADPETFYREGLEAAGFEEAEGTRSAYLDITEVQFRREDAATVVWLTIDEGDRRATLSAQPAVSPC